MNNATGSNFNSIQRRDLYTGFYSIIYDIMDEYSPEMVDQKEATVRQLLIQHLNYYVEYILEMSNDDIQLLKIEKEVNEFFNK